MTFNHKKDGFKKPGFNTSAIHGNEDKKPANSLNSPIFMTSTFTFDNLIKAEDAFSFASDDYVYTRGNNPNLREFERKMSILEEGKDSVAFSTGMAAISTVLFSLLNAGDKLIAHQVLYGSTYKLIASILKGYGIETEFVDLKDTDNLKKALCDNTKVIYLETPANPTLELIDIAAVAEIAREKGVKVVVDNTFATPFFQKPLSLGADIVVHSATKYLSGHGDVLGGVAVSKDEEYIHNLKFGYMTEFGGVLSPFNAWLILRGLKTLGLRMEKHQENARRIVEFLLQHDKVEKVYYPELNDISGFREQMTGYGAIISFELKADLIKSRIFVDKLKLIKLAVSLGDVETLIEYPFYMTHRNYPEDLLYKLGLSKKLLRLSVGLEDVCDIIEDLEQALEYV
ncbi:MAG: PLP-dependent transferase [Halanaerobiaceae bacterium]|nr:PLP-dependent transferase [Halanaerobiaceae bacterium]